MSDIRFNRWLHQSGTGGVYQDSSGNVGVGTSVPRASIDIAVGSASSIRIGTAITISHSNGIQVGSSSLHSTGLNVQSINSTGIITATTFSGNLNSTGVTTVTTLNIGTGASISSPASNVLTLGTNNVEVARFDSSGRLGIGTNNPVNRFHATQYSANTDVATFQIGSASAYTGFVNCRVGTTGSGTFIGGLYTPDGSLQGLQGTNGLIFSTSGSNTERVRITSGGNLGIGTTNPQARLSVGAGSLVDANVPIQISSQSATGLAYYGANNNGSYGALFGYDRNSFSGGVIRVVGSTDNISFAVNNTTVAGTFDSNGRLGIGTTNPSSLLHLYGNGPQLNAQGITGESQIRISSTTGNYRRIIFFDSAATPTKNNFEIAVQEVDNSLFFGPSTDVGGLTFSGSTGLRVDSSGRVTTPSQPAFTAYLSTTYAYTGSGGRRVVPFDTVVTNIGSHFNTTSNRFVAPVAGMYLFTASLVCNSGSSTTYFSCEIFVNAAAVVGSTGWQNMGAGYQNQRNSLIVYLNVNDYVDVRMEKSANDSINAANTSSFTGTLLG